MSQVIIGARPEDAVLASQIGQGKQFGLGDRFTDHAGREWVYLQAATAIAPGFVVQFTTGYLASTITSTNAAFGNLVAVNSISADTYAIGDQGWFQVKGPADNCQVLASAAANTRLNTTATAGALDDDNATGAEVILGIALTAARAASQGNAPAILNYPSVGVTL